jgi:hypothetical protein
VHKFTQGKKNFDLMLGKQKCVFDRGRIGYKPSLKQKSFENIFVKASNITCSFCNKCGHVAFKCLIKKKLHFQRNKWVQGSTSTNYQGPKVKWVPRSKFESTLVGDFKDKKQLVLG